MMKFYGRISTVLIVILVVAAWHASYFLIDAKDSYRFFVSYGFLKYDFIYTPLILPFFWWLGKKYDEAKFFSEKDYLTKSFNRRYVYKAFPKLQKKADKNHANLSLFIVDIDNFKVINDLHGHELGDVVLQEISRILLKNARKSDIVARWGGDEFLIIMGRDMEISASAWIRLIELELLEISKKIGINLSVSVGKAAYFEKRDSMDGLILLADKRMYDMKKQHKGIC